VFRRETDEHSSTPAATGSEGNSAPPNRLLKTLFTDRHSLLGNIRPRNARYVIGNASCDADPLMGYFRRTIAGQIRRQHGQDDLILAVGPWGCFTLMSNRHRSYLQLVRRRSELDP
jgi:hypothetical protein